MSKQSYIEFTELRALVQALHLYKVEFPSKVQRVDKTGWAVPEQAFTKNNRHFNDSAFKRLAAQCGWQTTLRHQGRPPGKAELLRDVIDGEWHYVDPNSLVLKSKAWYRNHSLYILGARDQAHAQHLLDVLTSMLVPHIEARPLLVIGPKNKTTYSFFWVIQVASDTLHPPLMALQAAERVWWGPVASHRNRTVIFEEWPYHMSIAKNEGDDQTSEILAKVNWGEQDRLVVLLSNTDHHRLLLNVEKGGAFFNALIDVATLEAQEQRPAQTIATADETDLNFRVRLKLVPKGSEALLQDRIADLKLELNAKGDYLEWLQDQAKALSQRQPTFAPLYLYPSQQGEIPRRLQRLLIEWSDQEEDLQALRYQKITADSLPPGLAEDASEVHVVTTASALGQDITESDFTAGLRLREYAPSHGLGVYVLLTQWAHKNIGLRLFAPEGKYLALYPEMRPTPTAAHKLAQAIFGKYAAGDSVALLIPTGGGQFSCCRISSNHFKPLVSAFGWQCALDVQPNGFSVHIPSQQASQRVIQSMEDAFGTAMCGEAARRLAEKRAMFQQEIDERVSTLKAEATKRSARTKELEEILRQTGTLFSQVNTACSTLDANHQELITNLATLSKQAGTAKKLAAKIETVSDILNTLRGDAAALDQRYKDALLKLKHD